MPGFSELIPLLIPALGFADANFKSGVTLRNEDSKSQIVMYDETVNTAICELQKDNKLKWKKGVATAFTRKSTDGYKVLASRSNTLQKTFPVRAQISGESIVYCLCASECSVDLEGGNKVTVPNGKIVVILNNKLSVKDN